MDDKDYELMNKFPFERVWNPDDLADWREFLDKWMDIDKVRKLHRKIYGARDFSLDILMGLNFLENKLDENYQKQLREAIALSIEEDKAFYLHYRTDLDDESCEQEL